MPSGFATVRSFHLHLRFQFLIPILHHNPICSNSISHCCHRSPLSCSYSNQKLNSMNRRFRYHYDLCFFGIFCCYFILVMRMRFYKPWNHEYWLEKLLSFKSLLCELLFHLFTLGVSIPGERELLHHERYYELSINSYLNLKLSFLETF